MLASNTILQNRYRVIRELGHGGMGTVYEALAGTSGDYSGILNEMAWHRDNSRKQSHVVGSKKANGFGLFDMHGNVWEWCLDAYHANYDKAPPDGSVWLSGGIPNSRVSRGGSWLNVALPNFPSSLRCSSRIMLKPDFRRSDYGFRVVGIARTQ